MQSTIALKDVKPATLVFTACLIQILSFMTVATFPSLIPVFQDIWGISNTEAGTISGVYFIGELITVTIASATMDKWDGRPMFLVGLLIGTLAAAGFALSNGLISASFWRFMQGAAVGLTYIPGLKILTDHLPKKYQSRGTSLYTATFYIAVGASFFLALQTEPLFGWQTTFIIAAAAPLIGLVIAIFYIPPSPPPENEPHIRGGLFDFRVAFRNKKAIGFSIVYGLHNLELAAFSTWLVPFFAFSQRDRLISGDLTLELFGILAAIISMAALPSSIGFNEVAHKTGRQKLIALIAVASTVIGIAFVFTAGLALWVGVSIAILFSMAIAADSATISGGIIRVADPVHKGRTMSIYSLIGFTGAAIGPMIFGVILDIAGGETIFTAWLAAYASVAFFALLAPFVVWRWIGYAEPIK